MRKVLFIAAMFLTGFVASAQQSLGEGNLQINGGFPFVATQFNTSVLPLYVGADYGVHQDVTVGGQFNVLFGGSALAWGVSANANYHFNSLLDLPNQWDLYAGGSLSYARVLTIGAFGFGPQIGARYFFNDKWGINLQFGGDYRALSAGGGQIGVTYKL